MPTYSYKCTECDTAFDAQQSFTDDALITCPTCGGRLRKVFGSIGVSFTGSGFYRNDSRAETKKNDSKSNDGTKTDKKQPGETKKDAPAPAKTDASPSPAKKDAAPAKSTSSSSAGQAA